MPLGWILMAFSCPGGKPSCVTLVTPKMAPYWVSVDRSSSTPGMGSVTAPWKLLVAGTLNEIGASGRVG